MSFFINAIFSLSILKVNSKVMLNGNTIIYISDKSFIKFKSYIPKEIFDSQFNNKYHIQICLRNNNDYYMLHKIDSESQISTQYDGINVYNMKCKIPITSDKNNNDFRVCFILYCAENKQNSDKMIYQKLVELSMYSIEIYKRFPFSRELEYPFRQVCESEIKLIDKCDDCNSEICMYNIKSNHNNCIVNSNNVIHMIKYNENTN